MRFFILVLLLAVSACQAGNLPEERQALYERNVPDCSEMPDRCVNGYPW